MTVDDSWNNDETTQPEIGRAFDDAVYILRRQLFDVQEGCNELASALTRRDLQQIEITANRLVAQCGTAQAASKTIGHRLAAALVSEEHMKTALRAHSLAVDALLRQAATLTVGTAQQVTLLRLASQLGLPAREESTEIDPRSTTS